MADTGVRMIDSKSNQEQYGPKYGKGGTLTRHLLHPHCSPAKNNVVSEKLLLSKTVKHKHGFM